MSHLMIFVETKSKHITTTEQNTDNKIMYISYNYTQTKYSERGRVSHTFCTKRQCGLGRLLYQYKLDQLKHQFSLEPLMYSNKNNL